jgi:hypothetical protein
MSLTINLPPEVETRLREEAARRGQETEEYASRLLSEVVESQAEVSPRTMTPWERAQAFREWAASHKVVAPPIPSEALRRENMYEARGL